MAADKSHLYKNAGLPVNEYVPGGLLQGELGSAMGFSNAAQNSTLSGAVNLDHPAASGQAGLFYDDGIDWANPDLTYDIPADDMQANYEYEAYGGPRGPDWVFNPNATTPEPNRTPTTNPSGVGGGGYRGVAQAAPIPQNVLTSQNLFQRNPSGSMYAPDLSVYNDSSLFNYIGPGGVDEYTYGQDLPYQGAGYDIWGSPTNVPNPYYEGQFAPEPVITEPQGPADGAIGLPPVDMPAGVSPTNNNPNVGTNTTNINTGQDLTYAETLAEMGINPADAPSTTFPSPGDIVDDTVAPTLGTPSPHGDWNDFLSPDTVVTDEGLPESFDFVGDTADDRFRPPPFLGKPLPHTGEKDFLPTDVPAIGAEATEPFDFVGDTADDRFRPENYLDADIANNRPMNFAYHAGAGSPHLGEAPMQFAGSSANLDAEKIGPKTGPSGQGGRDLITDTADSRFRPEGSPDAEDVNSTLARDVAAGMLKNQQELQAKGKALQDMYDAFEAPIIRDNIFNEHFDRNQAEYSAPLFQGDPIEAAIDLEYPGAKQITDFVDAIDGDTNAYKKILAQDGQISKGKGATEPTADDYGVPLTMPQGLDDEFYANNQDSRRGPLQAKFSREVLDAMATGDDAYFADAAANKRGDFAGSSADLGGLLQETKTGPSGQGGRTSVFDEQQNYQVPAEEISPGEVGLLNGIVEGLQNYGPNSDRTLLEDQAWDKYYDYKNAGAEALNKGEIDAQAFNELKGKAGGSTVIDHFVDKGDHPVINSLFTNAANVLYQGVQTIATDQTIAEGIKDIWQQGSGANDSTPLGSVVEEIARAKEATEQRKKVQENIFTPGPLKYAATARDYTPTIVKEDKPTRIPVVQNKVNNNSTRKKVGFSGRNARSIGYSFPSGPVGRRYGL